MYSKTSILLLVLFVCCGLADFTDVKVFNRTGILEGTAHLKTENKNYYLGIYVKANYFQATEFCRYHGMRLATIDSKEENDEIVAYMNSLGLGGKYLWISGSDLGHEGSFVWMSTGVPLTYKNFSPGQPDNHGGNEHCLELWDFGKFNDRTCNTEQHFVCEY